MHSIDAGAAGISIAPLCPLQHPAVPCTPRFYFAVSNTRAGQPYQFKIINLLKDDSLYNHGMLPLVHSERRLTEEVGLPTCCCC
jgi:hypothetical protein